MDDFFKVVATMVAVLVLPVAALYLVIPTMTLLKNFLGRLLAFVPTMIAEAVRLVGQLVTCGVFVVLMLGNAIGGRRMASDHFARAARAELTAAIASLYRLALRHPAHLFGLAPALEGLEHRVPAVVMASPGGAEPGPVAAGAAANFSPTPPPSPAHAHPGGAPTADAVDPSAMGEGYRHLGPVRRAATNKFDGYEIIGTLPGGGSGSRLYVARPDAIRRAGFERSGQHGVGDVVIKVFSVNDGSSLPQIVRESRALEAARRMGLVLEHQLTPERFLYVMRYVPGDSLGLVAERLHAASGPEGLEDRAVRSVVGYAADLVGTLAQYHAAGLWHKDIKPDNIIVSTADGRAHLVDFGLLTPLRSAMTLTTHGTEYFRDPEMVRMALRGVKVADVDGVKFDIYGAGAVLYAILENSFPAHGAMSQITKRCPEALRWIVRRAMTDYEKRYASADAMLADLRVVLTAADPFAVKPGMLPSVARGESEPVAAAAQAEAPAAPRSPRGRMSAADQLARARERVARRRGRFAGGQFPWVSGLHGPRHGAPNFPVRRVAVVVLMVVLVFFVFRDRSGGTGDAGAGVSAREGTPARASSRQSRTSNGVRTVAQGAGKAAPVDPEAIGVPSGKVAGLTVLVVAEWTAATTAADRTALAERVARRVEGLRARGFEVVEGDRASELESEARSRVGARPIGSDNAQEALKQWITARADGPDAVVWFADGREGLLGLVTHVAGGPKLDAGARKLAGEALPGWAAK